MMFHAVAKHIQTNRHKRLHTRVATAIVQAHAVGTGTVPQDHRQSNQTPHLLLSKRHKTMILNGSRSESALGRQRHDVNATHRDEVFQCFLRSASGTMVGQTGFPYFPSRPVHPFAGQPSSVMPQPAYPNHQSKEGAHTN